MMNLDTAGFAAAVKYLDKTSKNIKVAGPYALKKVGFKYGKTMRTELAKGTPGGRPADEMTVLAKRSKRSSGRRGKAVPGGHLGKEVRNYVYNKKKLEVGILDKGPYASKKKIIDSAKRLVTGVKRKVTESLRGSLAKIGKSKRGASYSLKKSTRILITPPRPFIKYFLIRYHRAIIKDFEKVYFAKAKGKNIRL